MYQASAVPPTAEVFLTTLTGPRHQQSAAMNVRRHKLPLLSDRGSLEGVRRRFLGRVR
jgi:hypothetical protein